MTSFLVNEIRQESRQWAGLQSGEISHVVLLLYFTELSSGPSVASMSGLSSEQAKNKDELTDFSLQITALGYPPSSIHKEMDSVIPMLLVGVAQTGP